MSEGVVVGVEGNQHSFIDNGGSVLAVAHCDFVGGNGTNYTAVKLKSDVMVYCPTLDDRLGVYTVLDLLPAMGIKVDVLLTENEEIGASTAKQFTHGKKYNWIVEFDRCGTDCVSYEYHFDDAEDYFAQGMGSFSDICLLEHLGCKGFNVGVGYYNEHTQYCNMSVKDYVSQISKFMLLWEDMKDTHYEHQAVLWYDTQLEEPMDVFDCPSCGYWWDVEEAFQTGDGYICPQCGILTEQ